MPHTPSILEPPPQTVWECCLVWADLLIRRHTEVLEQSRQGQHFKFSEEETALYVGLDRHLVSFLIAAALHERTLRLELALADAVFVPLAAPHEEGATGTLRRSPYSALELSPDLEDQGRSSRTLLLREALSPHPDNRLLWERVRTAALDVVDSVVARTPARHTGPRHPEVRGEGPYWERGITIGDVILGEHRRLELERLAEFYGEGV
ncbi:hypothetical protein [Streptomyces sp. NPDC088141]|uniref:hypothetical protein n=1 Tax=Streptomyces sp. NPDC088141 TaxID=3155179 RepID=UPI0034470A75